MRIEEYLRSSAADHGEKVALVVGEERLSYRELDLRSDRLAGALRRQGFARGDRAIVFMDNSWEAVVAIFAVMKAGGVFSPLNPSTKPEKLSYVLNNCRATALLTQNRLWPPATEALKSSPTVAITAVAGGDGGTLAFDRAVQDESLEAPAAPGIDLDLSMLVYTSGSTGRPKGVMMTHQNVDAAATSITTYLEARASDVVLSALPISFDYGLYQVLMAAKVGATLILEKSFLFPYKVLEKIAAERVTGFPLVPTMASMILQMKSLPGDGFPHLRYVTNTAAALPPAHIMRLQEIFPATRLYSMYGLTECKRCTWMPPEALRERPASVGIAIPGTEAFVADENGQPVPPRVEGELVIRGGHVMKGYWEDPEATDKALRPGPFPWEKLLYTGDVFYRDEAGYLYFVGRKDDIIKTRGEKVSPKEVEAVLYALPGIREAAVVGVPDPLLGAAIKAVVSIDPEAALSERAVIAHCAAHLEDFMVPRHVEIRADLPKTESGKISRRGLVEEAL